MGGDQLEFVTFLLALVGYAGLTTVTVMTAGGHVPTRLLRMTAAVIVTHVLMVWHVRYDWEFSEATRNGYAGFILFHSALGAIVSSTVTPPQISRKLLTAAFLVISLGASVATFKYDVVRNYRIPVMLIAFTGLIMSGYYSRRAAGQPTA